MDILQIKLMYKEALDRLNDAEILSENLKRQTDSNYLLDLLALELLLKCLLRIHGSHVKGHDYEALFNALPKKIRNHIVKLAQDRMSTSADYSNLNNLLKTWGKNFILLRYPYEKYEGMSEEEYRELGIKWIENGAQIEDATFVYYPSELFGFNHALKQLVHEFIANK